MITPLTPLPLPPTRQDPVNFAARADAFLAALPDFQVELNTLASELDLIGSNATQSEINAAQSASDAQDAADAAGAFANYKGLWSSLTGPLNKPASVKHNGKYWNLLNNLANVQSSEPGVSADWEESDLVRVTGANFTGPITVPPGATGNQVPTVDDVDGLLSTKADLAGANFTGPITVPAGATGTQVPQAQEALLLAVGGTVTGETTLVKTLTPPDTTTLSSGTQTIDIGTVPSNVMAVEITGNSTLTITSSKTGAWMLLGLRITSGTVTWDNVAWRTPGAAAPTIGASRRFFLFYAQAASALIYGFTVGEPS